MRPKLNHQSNGSFALGSSNNNSNLNATNVVNTLANTTATTSTGIINPVFVSDLVESNETLPPTSSVIPTKPSKQPLHQHRASTSITGSESSSEVTLVTNVSDNRRTLTTSSAEIGDVPSHQSSSIKHSPINNNNNNNVDPSCDYCYHFHVNNHQTHRRNNHSSQSHVESQDSPLSSYIYHQPPYAPYPPQWYYLLAADTKQFRKHKHSHYRRDCKVCRQIVRKTFEQYYLRNNLSIAMQPSNNNRRIIANGSGSDSPDSSGSLVPMSFMSDHHSDPLLETATSSSNSVSPLSIVFLPR